MSNYLDFQTAYALALGPDEFYVTAADLVVLGNTSGTNTGDNAVNALYSGLETNVTTNLSYIAAAGQGTVVSSDGTDAVLPLANGTNAGLLSNSDFSKLAAITGTNTGDNAINSRYESLETNVTTNLSYIAAALQGTIVSSDGTNAIIPAADGTNAGLLINTDYLKLQSVESGATADQTGAEIKAAYEGEANTNAFTDAYQTLVDNAAQQATTYTKTESDAITDLLAPQASTYTKSEVDAITDALITGLDWKESVATFADLATTYPSPDEGWVASVDADDAVYRYNGTDWVVLSSGGTIPLASASVDGKMSSSDFIKLAAITGTHTGNNTGDNAVNTLYDSLETNVDTNLSYTASPTNGIVNSSDGTNATLPLANGTDAGLMSPADFTKLAAITGTNTGDNAPNSLYEGLENTPLASASVDGSITSLMFTKIQNIEDNATADQTPGEILSALLTVDGTGTGLDADLLDGFEATYFAVAADTYTESEVDALIDGVGGIRADVTPTNWASGNANAVDNGIYTPNLTAAGTLTLPASPAAGTYIRINDIYGKFDTYNLTILRNTNPIMSLTEDMVVSTKYAAFSLTYINATVGWAITDQ